LGSIRKEGESLLDMNYSTAKARIKPDNLAEVD